MEITKAVAIIGGGGLGTFVAAPVVVGAVLSMIGFKASGIAAGSLAESMMSSSAIASGGGVAAGGVVATLQSAGVLGLGSGVSAATGAVVSGATALIKYYPSRSRLMKKTFVKYKADFGFSSPY